MNKRAKIAVGFISVGAGILALYLLSLSQDGSFTQKLAAAILAPGYASAVLRMSVPIGFAALGGIFAEKSGVINIGLEGLLIFSALGSLGTVTVLSSWGIGGQLGLWLGFFTGVVISIIVSLLFALLTIKFKSDQIIAGLAVWIVALGIAPFTSLVLWGSVNSPTIKTFGTWTTPVLSEIPYIGPVFFDASPMVYLLLIAVPASWYTLYHTAFGHWVLASGENPDALASAGISVKRTRYYAVLLSGLFSGIGGAGFTIGALGNFIGLGTTSIAGRGWLGIVAYLFGNYNPIATFGGTLIFAGFDALQIRMQYLSDVGIPSPIIQSLPYVVVIVVLMFYGQTRFPAAAGEHYETEEGD